MNRAISVLAVLTAIAALAGACKKASASSSNESDAGSGDIDSGAVAEDAGSDASVDAAGAAAAVKESTCATTFGSALTPAFGRLDGTVVAIVQPNYQACALPNSDHLVIQATMGGAVYRLVVDVESTASGVDPRVLYKSIQHAMVGEPWSDGWHTTDPLDYVADLGLHSDATWVPYEINDLSLLITSQIEIGSKISIFSTATSAEPDSAHLVHRNLPSQDGAIVIDPDGANPTFLLMHFAEQTF